jgi:hypothetical protein
MPSRREQILDAVVTALGAVGKPSGLTVHRNRVLPIERDTLPAVVVYAIEEEMERGPNPTGPRARRRFTLRLEHRVEVTSGTSPDEALDPLLCWGTQQLAADGRWGGLAHLTTEQRTQWSAVDVDRVFGGAAQDFLIDYVTAAGDQTAEA